MSAGAGVIVIIVALVLNFLRICMVPRLITQRREEKSEERKALEEKRKARSPEERFTEEKAKIDVKRNRIKAYKVVVSILLFIAFMGVGALIVYGINASLTKNHEYTYRYIDSSETCYITDTGDCFHAAGCQHLWNSQYKTTVREATIQGFSQCEDCFGDFSSSLRYTSGSGTRTDGGLTFEKHGGAICGIFALLFFAFVIVKNTLVPKLENHLAEKYNRLESKAKFFILGEDIT